MTCVWSIFLNLFQKRYGCSQLLLSLIVDNWTVLGTWIDSLAMISCWVMCMHENIQEFYGFTLYRYPWMILSWGCMWFLLLMRDPSFLSWLICIMGSKRILPNIQTQHPWPLWGLQTLLKHTKNIHLRNKLLIIFIILDFPPHFLLIFYRFCSLSQH
jgi:hypothetical protein